MLSYDSGIEVKKENDDHAGGDEDIELELNTPRDSIDRDRRTRYDVSINPLANDSDVENLPENACIMPDPTMSLR